MQVYALWYFCWAWQSVSHAFLFNWSIIQHSHVCLLRNIILHDMCYCCISLSGFIDVNGDCFIFSCLGNNHNSNHVWPLWWWLLVIISRSLQWHHNGRGGFSNHQPHHCLLICLLKCRSKKTSKPCVTGLCLGNSLVTGEQKASNTENVSIWWRHHGTVFISLGQ